MELALIIYFIDHLLQAIKDISTFFAIIFGVACFVCCGAFVVASDNKDEQDKKLYKYYIKLCGLIFIFLVLLAVFTPKKETGYAMLAAYGVQSATKLEQVQRMAPKSLELLELTLDKKLSELTTNEENQDGQ